MSQNWRDWFVVVLDVPYDDEVLVLNNGHGKTLLYRKIPKRYQHLPVFGDEKTFWDYHSADNLDGAELPVSVLEAGFAADFLHFQRRNCVIAR